MRKLNNPILRVLDSCLSFFPHCVGCFTFTGEDARFEVVNAQTYAGYVVHVGSISSGSIKVDYLRLVLLFNFYVDVFFFLD